MKELTEEDADFAFAVLEYFRDHVLDIESEELPTVDNLASCVATLVLWHQLDPSTPKISKLTRLLARNGVAYSQLLDLLEPFYLRVLELREYESDRIKREALAKSADVRGDDDLF